MTSIDPQSPDIAQGVDTAFETRTGTSGEDVLNAQGAGDQGMMFGYACDETDDLMPLPIWLAHRLAHRLAEVRKAGILPYLRPDGKTQVTFDYEDGRPVALKTVLISTQHQPGLDAETLIKPDLIEHVIHPLLPAAVRRRRTSRCSSTRRAPSSSAAPTPTAASPGARSSSTPTAAWPATAAAPSPARTRRRSTARPPTPPAGWPRTSSPPARPAAARSRSPTPSASPSPCRSSSRPSAPSTVDPAKIADAVQRGLRPAPGGHHPRPRPAPADLQEDRRLRPLRPQRQGVHLGADHPRRRPEVRPRALAVAEASFADEPAVSTQRVVRSSRTSRRSTRPSTTWSRTRSGTRCASGPSSGSALHGRRVGGWVVEVDVDAAGRRRASGRWPRSAGWGPPPELIDLAGWAAWRWAGRPAPLPAHRVAARRVIACAARPCRPRRAPPDRVALDRRRRPAHGQAVLRCPPAADARPRWPSPPRGGARRSWSPHRTAVADRLAGCGSGRRRRWRCTPATGPGRRRAPTRRRRPGRGVGAGRAGWPPWSCSTSTTRRTRRSRRRPGTPATWPSSGPGERACRAC